MPQRAGFWIRVLAAVIDIVAMIVISIALAVMMQAIPDVDARTVQTIVYAAWLGYTTFEIWTAATPGKLILRLRISEQDCTPAEFWRRVLRWSTKQFWLIAYLFFLLSTSWVLYAIGGFSSLIVTIGSLYAANDDRLTWHDQWAHTAVCRLPPRRGAGARPIPPPIPPAQTPPNT